MGNPAKKYSPEVRDRAVRLFQEHVHEYSRLALYNAHAAKPRMAAEPRRTMMSLEPQQAARASHP